MGAFERVRPVETLQPPYHLFRRDIEAEVLPYCQEHDIGVFVYGPLAHGLLGGGVTDHSRFDAGDWRSRSPLFAGDGFERNLERVHALRRFARERGVTISQIAIAWTLAHPAVHAAIVGTSRLHHIDESVSAASLELDDTDLWRIDQIMRGAMAVGGPSPTAPAAHPSRVNADRDWSGRRSG
jgi:aryl-alcohol dehydrogenase-like predicted oxidoreductase